jgi:hypothetical protein
MGPKEGQYKSYQTLNYIEKNIEGINPQDVESLGIVSGRLFQWL